MTTAEKQALLKIMKDVKNMKEQMDYLVDAVELIVQIQTEQIKKGKRY